MSLSAVSQSYPQPVPPGASMTTLRGLLQQVLQVQQGSVDAEVDLGESAVQTPGLYDCLDVAIPADTHVESRLEVEHDAQGRRCLAGWLHFSRPLTLTNGVRAFTERKGLWTLVRPLANWATQYAFDGITFGTGRDTLVHGRASLLGLHAGWLDRRINRAVAQAEPPTLESPSLRLALRAVSAVGQAATGPGTWHMQATGVLPAGVPVGLSDQSFALIPGGAYHLRTGGTFQLRQPGTIDLRVQPPQQQSTFQSAALDFALRAHATFSLEDDVNQRLHMRSAGRLDLTVGRLAFDVRDRDMPDSGGIRVAGGELRRSRATVPALTAPVDFSYLRSTLNASGLLHVNAGATFVDPGAQPPAFEDDHEACDVKGTLDLSAIVPHLGHPPLPMQRTPPDYAIRGIISVRPPSSDPVYYRMDVTPKGPDFELQPDYKPSPALLRTA